MRFLNRNARSRSSGVSGNGCQRPSGIWAVMCMRLPRTPTLRRSIRKGQRSPARAMPFVLDRWRCPSSSSKLSCTGCAGNQPRRAHPPQFARQRFRRVHPVRIPMASGARFRAMANHHSTHGESAGLLLAAPGKVNTIRPSCDTIVGGVRALILQAGLAMSPRTPRPPVRRETRV